MFYLTRKFLRPKPITAKTNCSKTVKIPVKFNITNLGDQKFKQTASNMLTQNKDSMNGQ